MGLLKALGYCAEYASHVVNWHLDMLMYMMRYCLACGGNLVGRCGFDLTDSKN